MQYLLLLMGFLLFLYRPRAFQSLVRHWKIILSIVGGILLTRFVLHHLMIVNPRNFMPMLPVLQPMLCIGFGVLIYRALTGEL